MWVCLFLLRFWMLYVVDVLVVDFVGVLFEG